LSDLKISELTAYTTPQDNDLLPIVDDVGGETKKITYSDLSIPTKATASEVATGTDDTKYTTPLAVAPYANQSLYRQAIINGNFDVWQRGTSFTNPASGSYLADRWQTNFTLDGGTNPTIIFSRQLITPGSITGGYYFARVNVDGAGSDYGNGSFTNLVQRIENGTRFLCGDGKQITFSFWAKSDIANKRLGIAAIQQYGTGGSPSGVDILIGEAVTLTSSWAKYTVTMDTTTLTGKTFGTDNNDQINIQFNLNWGVNLASRYNTDTAEDFGGAGNIDIAQVQLCAGSVALPFQPKSYAEELRDCQRYYWRFKPESGGIIRGLVGTCSSTSNFRFQMPLITTMRTVPTLETTSTTTDYAVGDGATATASTAVPALSATGNTRESVSIDTATGATLTQFRPAFLNITTDTAYLGFSAEL
jgi:hypothetical protein